MNLHGDERNVREPKQYTNIAILSFWFILHFFNIFWIEFSDKLFIL